jgi:preprotein translocase subunit YajC
MNFMATLVMWAAAPAPGAGGGLGMLLPILLFIPLLYLLMIRPQQKRQKQWQQMLAGIKSGDKITTAGGIRGVILSIKDDSIIIRVAPDNLKQSGQDRDRLGHHAG